MKKLLLSFFMTCAISTGMNSQTLIYSNDFEEGLNGATIIGNGTLMESGNESHGQVFKNDPALTNAVRTNYLLLPDNIFTDFQNSGSQGLTVSFWVNKSDATNFYWSAMFAAYGAAPAGENAKPALTLMSRQTGLVNFDYANAVDGATYGYSAFEGSGNQSTAWLDAKEWNFYVCTITPEAATVFINGLQVNKFVFDGSPTNNVEGLFKVASELKYVTLGGNQAWGWNDPDPAFMFDKVKIYAGALNTGQISSLMNTDQLDAPTLAASHTAVYLDNEYPLESVFVNGINLTEDIQITAPEGITVSPEFISKDNASNAELLIFYDGESTIEGVITLSSANLEHSMTIKTSTNEGCFIPAYEEGNMIADPTFSAATLSAGDFGGWGPVGIDYETPYCGRGSAFIRGTCWPDGGSLDRTLSVEKGNELKPNTRYRLRAMLNIKATPDTYFQFQIEGYDGSESLFFLLGQTEGWVQFDTTFVTGATVVTDKGIYFNSCTSSTPAITDTAFIDNYELYEIPMNTNIDVQHISEPKAYVKNQSIISEFSLNASSVVTFSVVDLQGKLVQTSSLHFDDGNNFHSLKSGLPNGIYVLKIASEEFTQNFKLIINN